MKSTLYLHVGHSKTGTSWLQAALRENADALAEAGLAYPILEGVGVEQGAEIGQGNGLWLATGPAGELELRLRMIARAAGPAGAVLSAEEFFPRLARHDDPAVLPRAARAAGFGGIEILLFIRNPVGHAASLWQQYLKTAGGTAPIEAFFEKYSVPELVAQFLDRFMPIDGAGLTCLSYDRHRHDLLAPLRAWLGLPAATLAPPCAPTINRGMTRGELALQVALNRPIGRAGRWQAAAALVIMFIYCSGFARNQRILPARLDQTGDIRSRWGRTLRLKMPQRTCSLLLFKRAMT